MHPTKSQKASVSLSFKSLAWKAVPEPGAPLSVTTSDLINQHNIDPAKSPIPVKKIQIHAIASANADIK